ncbi:MAG: hypothetical protein A3H57_01740 [Candidatus Taylorbacteria bacterium RIFCSPLOWO2_02_FULL_43_11]|uniref:DUF5671 domain-containing protein n=1 Tax=Candidatus Taylorbacteria bacterium RIFCSPHIGHO2_02_FULL_43_32b TaxID=1802306 RepID=A0A1G2MEA4_9BACT|nr:MAG: hypothetical protein A2743_00100 [Candidatus Taylorbacteria bacterium RIFCSPHIGHO2_01_FULL_43_47]OHA22218.1 MAG: hypothetical protein A3C72_04040 [Candidatus Taylorbacteria bacterium RIFCSPHIGHO2_02_FULL_43_32b]OHA29053.1 MAG: hypothetical protein A3B08_00205 [Candidatus Taylorbacteria bacterium RIFCSPLOWO2_01_FULL_43_44]OHA35711.1 MAG: hypothetical protein A3H57_01740 [Candidatus Taylorbacteria bacterium RIFCSPLOWO2_02_FULL_43_11]
MKKILKASTVLALLSPVIALAQSVGGGIIPGGITPVGPAVGLEDGVPAAGTDNISKVLSLVSYWLVIVATIVIAIGLITFLWGVVQYITAGADEEKRAAARNMMLYGIIGLFVMVSVWGLVYFLGSLLGITPGGGVDLPGVPAILNTDGGFGGGGEGGGEPAP